MSTPYPPTASAPQPAAVPVGKPPKSFGDRFARWVLIFVLLSIAGFALYTWAALNYTYSEGERVGFARKLSNKGWVCKTWEGEISTTNSVGAQESTFSFTVRDQSVVDKFRALEGKQVTVLYKERVGIPSSCFGDTPYHAYDVRGIK